MQKYSQEEIQTAKTLALDLISFSNKDLRLVANKKVSDSTRGETITELLIQEFGQDILFYRVYNPFGNDKLCSVVSYKKSDNVSVN